MVTLTTALAIYYPTKQPHKADYRYLLPRLVAARRAYRQELVADDNIDVEIVPIQANSNTFVVKLSASRPSTITAVSSISESEPPCENPSKLRASTPSTK